MDEEGPYDASDPKQVKTAIKKAQRWDDLRDNVIKAVMSTEDGRRWIRETIELAHVGSNPFSPDPVKMAFNCGELNIGQQFMAQIMNASSQLFMTMMAEANPPPATQDNDNG